MKCIVLAAGYGTRLHPLTFNIPKPLIKVNNKPVIEYIFDKISEIEVDEVIIITNGVFYKNFTEWYDEFIQTKKFSKTIKIISDNTVSNETRLGAVGDILFTLDTLKIDEDILVIAGDNLFEFSLVDYLDVYKRHKSSVIAVYNMNNLYSVKNFGVVSIDNRNRLLSFVEKPSTPKSSLIATGCYFFPKKTLPLFRDYRNLGNAVDRSGDFITWLYRQQPVYCYVSEDKWFDIGTHESLKEAEKYYKEKKVSY